MMAEKTRMRMTAKEYFALPESNLRMELIHGELIAYEGGDALSPAPKYLHQLVVANILVYLRRLVTTGTTVIAPMDVYLSETNVVQPDLFWVSGPDSLCRLGEDGYWYGAPDLVVEVSSPSTVELDRGIKFELYQHHGVREYSLADPEAKFVEVYVREGERFARRGVFGLGKVFSSEALGLTVEVSALLGEQGEGQ